MRIAHVITGLAAGGAEMQLASTIPYSRNSCEVIALYNVGCVGVTMRDAGITVVDLKMRSRLEFSSLVRLVARLRRGRFDVVHVHLYRATLYGRVSAALARVPVVVTTEHSLGERLIEGRPVTPGIRRLYLATEHCSTKTIAVSSKVKDRLTAWGIAAEKIVVIPNGVDLGRFCFNETRCQTQRTKLGFVEGDLVFGTVGRLVPSKGYALLLRAAAPRLLAGARLVLVGDGPMRPSLESLATQLGIAKNVVFLGERRDTVELLAAFDVFVSASAPGEETFGIAIVEALASGLPVVVTEAPALDERQHRLIHRVRCTEEGLRHGLSVAESTLGDWARADARPAFLSDYEVPRVARAIDDLYDDLRAARAGRRGGRR